MAKVAPEISLHPAQLPNTDAVSATDQITDVTDNGAVSRAADTEVVLPKED